MRAVARGPGCAPAVLVEINSEADKMDGGVLPAVRDGIAFVIDFNCSGCEQAAIVQFREEGQEPAFSGQCCARVLLGQFFSRGFEGSPRVQ